MVLSRLRRVHPRQQLEKITKSKRYKRGVVFIQKKPFTSFFIALGLFLLILIAGSVVSGLQQKAPEQKAVTKTVSTYTIGKVPTVNLQAQIEENGVIKIIAQTGGIVDKVHASEGDNVKEGQWLVSLATNYQGANAPALQAQLAGVQFKNIKETYDLQKDIIGKQRDIANTSAENTEQLRQISEKSLSDTRRLVDINQDAVDTLTTQIDTITQNNPSDPTLPGLISQKAQVQSGIDQLSTTVRTLEYQTNKDKPPTTLVNIQKDLTLKQLDVQEKALDLNKKVSAIQYNLAWVQESAMHPASPFAGTVERISVQEGQNIESGDVIATIASSHINTSAVVRAPAQIANSVSLTEPSVFMLNGKSYVLTPSYVSRVATDGQLYSIFYTFPEGVTEGLTDGQYVPVKVPVGFATSNGVVSYVPIDSVYESQNESTLYLLQDSKAVARKIEVGDVYGEYVQVTQGLHDGDTIILDRNVVAGDSVKTEN